MIRSRRGLTVEIHNTDAEGRLILCDALTEAGSEQPDILIDFATLTGAARTALGTAMPALFCNDEALATGLLTAAEREQDPLWRLPLHQPYREMLDSKIADIANAADSSYAGAITAALFLKEFVPEQIPWAHYDLMACISKPVGQDNRKAARRWRCGRYLAGWNSVTEPGRINAVITLFRSKLDGFFIFRAIHFFCDYSHYASSHN